MHKDGTEGGTGFFNAFTTGSCVYGKETGVGNNGFVIVRGKQPKAKGRKNDLLILVQEEPDSNEIIYVNQLCVDGVRHKENEWYGIAD